MAFEITHFSEAELSIIAWRGTLSLASVKSALTGLNTAPRMRLTLWDFSRVTTVTVTAPQIQSLVRETRNGSRVERAGGKTALVATSVFLFGLARQAQTYALLADPLPPLEIFPDRRAALAWFGVADGPWSVNGSPTPNKTAH